MDPALYLCSSHSPDCSPLEENWPHMLVHYTAADCMAVHKWSVDNLDNFVECKCYVKSHKMS